MIRWRACSPALLVLAGLALAPGSWAGAAEIRVPADHRTIQDAIDAAMAGDVVRVQPGRYQGTIRLKAGVSLRGSGVPTPAAAAGAAAGATILDADGRAPAVVMAEGSWIEGVTVTGAGRFDQAEFDRHHAERGESLPDERGAVGYPGSTAAIVADGVTATIIGCVVRDNGHAGIGLTGAGNRSTVRSNMVERNLGAGIGIATGAEPIVAGNECHHNLRAGIGCRASSPVIDGNHCHDNVRAGIGIREGATPVVLNNDCHDNQRAGIGIRMRGTEPRLHFNRCHRNGLAGIGCQDEAAPLIFQNECVSNRLAGIGAASDARPLIVGNRLHGNGEAALGFAACARGEAIVRDNEVIGASVVCLGINPGWRVRVENNRIRRAGDGPPLVMVFAGSRAEFTGNTFTGSGVAAIRTAGQTFIASNWFHCPNPPRTDPPLAVWSLEGATTSMTDDNRHEGWRWEPAPARRVGSRMELVTALREAGPGTTILLQPGIYAGGLAAELRGAPGQPIVIAAARSDQPPIIQGGSTALHLTDPTHVELRNLVLAGATANGLNIDDGGSFETPARDILLSGLAVREVGPRGNRDGIKLSGVHGFRIEHCRIERWGDGGSGVDLVGCHDGWIADSTFSHPGAEGANGVQAKGGSSRIVVRRCRFADAGGRAINLGGSTGTAFFRPRDATAEARDLTVEDSTFVGSAAPLAFVGVDGARVRHNRIEQPGRWIARILQENRDPRFRPCRDGRFSRNVVVFNSAALRTAVNVGPGTAPETFRFESNVWLCEDRPEETRRRIQLPGVETDGAYGPAARRERPWMAGVREMVGGAVSVP